MEFVFQFFNADNKHLPENIKLVQFYYDFDKSPWSSEEDGWLVKVYESLNTDDAVILEIPDGGITKCYCEIQYETIKTLPADGDLDIYDKNAEMLSCVLDDYTVSDISKIASKLKAENGLHSQIGGYPHWLQGNEHPENSDFQFLFQIDSEDEAGLMWSD